MLQVQELTQALLAPSLSAATPAPHNQNTQGPTIASPQLRSRHLTPHLCVHGCPEYSAKRPILTLSLLLFTEFLFVRLYLV